MFRTVCLRVSMWLILSKVLFFAKIEDVDFNSCHEVKDAFQMLRIGPLKWVPEVPGTGETLSRITHKLGYFSNANLS